MTREVQVQAAEHQPGEGAHPDPRGQLQTAEPVKLASLLVNHYGEEYAVRLTLQVLRAINQHLLAEELHQLISPGKRPPSALLSPVQLLAVRGVGWKVQRELIVQTSASY